MSLQPISFLPNKYVDGFVPFIIGPSISDLRLGSGICRNSTNNFDIVSEVDLAIKADTGSLDQGSYAANTMYAMHVIGDQFGYKPTDMLISLSATNPKLPLGYNAFRRVGWVRTNSITRFSQFICSSGSSQRTYTYLENTSELVVLSGGHAVVDTAVSLNTFVPLGTEIFMLEYDYLPLVAGRRLFIKPYGAMTVYMYQYAQVATVPITGIITDMSCNSTNNTFQYRLENAVDGVAFIVLGFKDNLDIV